jgi:hypothetical protein
MRRFPCSFAVFVVAYIVSLSNAASFAMAQSPPNAIVFPVTTELQTSLIGDKRYAAVILLNGTDIQFEAAKLDESGIDFEAIKKSLAEIEHKEGRLYVFSVVTKFHDDHIDLVTKRFDDLAKPLGYSRVIVSQHGIVPWHAFTASLGDPDAKDKEAKEDAVQKQGAKIYPVQSTLSRHLSSGADCIIDFQTPFDAKWDGLLDPDQFDEIKAAIDELKLAKRDKLLMCIKYDRAARDAVDRFSSNQDTGKALGFKSLSVQSTAR